MVFLKQIMIRLMGLFETIWSQSYVLIFDIKVLCINILVFSEDLILFEGLIWPILRTGSIIS